MMKFIGKLILLLLLVLPTTLMIVGNGRSGGMVALGADDRENDPMEGEDDEAEATVETDEGPVDEGAEEASVTESDTKGEEEEEEEEAPLKPSPDADTTILFTKPQGSTDLPAGFVVRLLVGFTNKGEKEFLVETMDASFRYPQDYSFYIQNFTTMTFNQAVEPKKQATFEYGFTPSESFSSRPFGLSIILNYKDSEGNQFQSAVFNETINVVEPDEGLDGETFFLYIVLAAIVVLILVGAQQLLSRFGKKIGTKGSKPKVEMGTQNADVDFDWIPKETLHAMNRSPGRSPKQSPRARRNKRASGAGEE